MRAKNYRVMKWQKSVISCTVVPVKSNENS
jgi:hypothetical protein